MAHGAHQVIVRDDPNDDRLYYWTGRVDPYGKPIFSPYETNARAFRSDRAAMEAYRWITGYVPVRVSRALRTSK